jgi:PAS domain S-box-containing protein
MFSLQTELPGSDPDHESPSDPPPLTEAQARTAFAIITQRNLLLITPVLSALFAGFTISHLFVLRGQARLIMCGAALSAAVAAVLFRRRIARADFPLAQANLMGALVAGLVWINSLLHLIVTREAHQATNLMLLICAVGIYSLSLRLIYLVIAASLIGWGVIALTIIPESSLHYLFGFGTASLLAVMSTIFRLRFFRRLEAFRLRDEKRRAELESSLEMTERARQEAVTSRLAVEDMLTAVQRAEERFRSFTGLEGIAIHEQGEILDANPSLADMFGYDPLEIIRTNALNLVAPESRREVRELLLGGEDTLLEATGLRKDGSSFPIEICAAATEYRHRAASVISIRDASERHEVMRKLRESEERYRELFELSPLPMGVIDRATRSFVAVNQAAIQHYGYTREEFIGLPVTAIYLPEDAPKLMERFDRPRARLSSFRAVRHRKKDGAIIDVEITTHDITWTNCPALLVLANDVTERLRAERELRLSEERYRRLFDASPLPMWVYDVDDFAFLAVNQAAISHYGYSHEEFLSMSALDIRSPEERHRLKEFAGTRLTGRKYAGIWEHRKKDGTIIQADIISDEITFAGKPARLVIAHDVTERLRREREARESEERYRQLFDISPMPMWVFDLETLRFLAVNKSAIRHYGYSRREFLSMSSTDIRPPEEVARYVGVASKDPKGIRNSGVWKHRKKDGTIIEVVISSHELTFGGRRARLVVANDITARKRVEEALRQYADRLKILREIDQAILAAQSPETISQSVLPMLQRLIPCDLTSVSAFDLAAGADTPLAVYARYESSDNPIQPMHLSPARIADLQRGKIFMIEDAEKYEPGSSGPGWLKSEGLRSYVNVPILAQGRLIAALNFASRQARAFSSEHLIIATDVANVLGIAIQNAQLYESERRARAAAETADRLKDEFLATVSHELRTPLNAIVGWNHLLRNRKLAPEIAQRALETIERNAKAQARLVNDLLDVSRIISGRLKLNVRTMDLIPLVEATLDSVRPAADAKSIALITSLDASAGLISGDADRLQQVLWNLLQNAIKFTPAGGQVSVALERAGDQLELSVSDTGKGISPEFLPYVFERFRQGDSSTTRLYGGLGLGLSIVRHLVELHGGAVRAMSAGEGFGATFTVCLPLAQLRISDSGLRIEGTLDDTAPARSRHSAILSGARVLIVEDESDTRELLALLLSQQGARTITVSVAEEAFAALRQWKPDLLISDLAMPDHDGYWLIRRVRELTAIEGGGIPAIALTAYARAEDRTRSLEAGFHLHLTKPFEPEELIRAAAQLLGRELEQQSFRN